MHAYVNTSLRHILYRWVGVFGRYRLSLQYHFHFLLLSAAVKSSWPNWLHWADRWSHVQVPRRWKHCPADGSSHEVRQIAPVPRGHARAIVLLECLRRQCGGCPGDHSIGSDTIPRYWEVGRVSRGMIHQYIRTYIVYVLIYTYIYMQI